MTLIPRLILAAVLMAGLSPAIAQVPAPVPALPDTERRTSYSISGTTCACNVNFALYGDSTDYQNWLEVFINGVRYDFNDVSHGWTITVPTGTLASRSRPISDAILTFNAVQTGTVQIVGARRPRRTSQFNENTGVPTRNFNQVLTDIIAQNREIWDKTNDMTGRGLFGLPGETIGLLPSAATRAGALLAFDGSGNPVATAPGVGTGNVVGPASSVNNDFACWNGTTGKLLKDCSASLSLTVGSSVINSGTTTRVLCDLAGILCEYAITGTGNVAMSAGPTFTGTVTASLIASAAQTITSASANAFVAGPNGATNPTFNVDASTASAAAGLSVKGNAAGNRVDLQVTSSGANEGFTLNGKGASTVFINNTGTGQVALGNGGGGVALSSALTYGGVTLNNAVTGTGNMALSVSPTFTGTLAAAALTATTVNGNTITPGTFTLTGAAGKTLTFSNSLTLLGTDATTMTFPTTTATIARTDAAQSFTGLQTLNTGLAVTGSVDITNNQNGASNVTLLNNSAGAAATTSFVVNNGSNSFAFGVQGTGKTPFGMLLANTGFIGNSSDLNIYSLAGKIGFAANGATEQMRLSTSGGLALGTALVTTDQGAGTFAGSGGLQTAPPTTKTTNYVALITDYSLIFNAVGSTTLTLLAPATYPGRQLLIKTIAAQTVISASANVVPLAGGAAGTAILAATAGKWAILVSDGANWQIMASN